MRLTSIVLLATFASCVVYAQGIGNIVQLWKRNEDDPLRHVKCLLPVLKDVQNDDANFAQCLGLFGTLSNIEQRGVLKKASALLGARAYCSTLCQANDQGQKNASSDAKAAEKKLADLIEDWEKKHEGQKMPEDLPERRDATTQVTIAQAVSKTASKLTTAMCGSCGAVTVQLAELIAENVHILVGNMCMASPCSKDVLTFVRSSIDKHCSDEESQPIKEMLQSFLSTENYQYWRAAACQVDTQPRLETPLNPDNICGTELVVNVILGLRKLLDIFKATAPRQAKIDKNFLNCLGDDLGTCFNFIKQWFPCTHCMSHMLDQSTLLSSYNATWTAALRNDISVKQTAQSKVNQNDTFYECKPDWVLGMPVSTVKALKIWL